MHDIVDDGTVIRIKGVGFFAPNEVQQHFANLASIVDGCRRLSRRVIALIDLRDASPQSAETTDVITRETNRIYSGKDDRVAILVSSMLLKLQVQRIHRKQGFEVFLSPAEAEEFLLASAAAIEPT